METVKNFVSSIFPSSLIVLGNVGLTGILYGLQYLLEKNSPCPCDPEWNTIYATLAFIVPALTLLLLSLLVIQNSRILLKCGTRIRSSENNKQKDSTDSSCCSVKTHKCSNDFPRFLVKTLMQICVPSMIWIVILLLDGDYVACTSATAINRTQDDLCKHLCSLKAPSYLLNKCYWSRISGEIVLLLSVLMLVLLKFCPTWIGCKCTQDNYYQVKYNHLLEKKQLTKMKEELGKEVENIASENAKKLITELKLGSVNQSGGQKSKKTISTKAEKANESASAP